MQDEVGAILGLETDQDTGWPTVTGDQDLLIRRQVKVPREVILDLRQSHPPSLG